MWIWYVLMALTGAAAGAGAAWCCSRWRKGAEQSLIDLVNVFDHAPIGVVFVSRDGRFLEMNSRFCSMLGYSRAELVGQAFSHLTHPDDVASSQDRLEQWNRRPGAGGTLAKRFITRDGRTVWVNIVTRLNEDEHGERFFITAVHDITNLVNATDALRDSEQRFRLLAENVPGVIYLCNNDERYTMQFLSERVMDLTGYPREQFLADQVSFVDLYHPDDAPRIVSHVEVALQKRQPYVLEYRIRHRDGHWVWIHEIGLGVFNEDDRLQFLEGFLLDITERKAAERRQTLLMRELNHRVKNNLATLLSIVQQTLQATSDPQEFEAALTGRVRALGEAHEMFAASSWQDVSLRRLAERVVAPYQCEGGQRVSVRGDDLALSPDTAQAVYMALHELATNAAKYGAWSTPGGRVDLAWTRQNGEVSLEWAEHGGPAVEPPTRRGFGVEMISGVIAYELDGETSIDFEPQGVRCRMRFPFPAPDKVAPTDG